MKQYGNLLAEMAKNGDTKTSLGEILQISSPTMTKKFDGSIQWKMREINILCRRYGKSYEELFL